MNAFLKHVVVAAGLALATQATAQVRLFAQEGFVGQSFTAEHQVANLAQFGFNDRASSIEVFGSWWEVCEHAQFGGRCVVLRPGRYANLADMNLNDRISSVRAVNLDDRQQYNPASTVGQITFFEHERFRGESITSEDDIANLGTHVFNGRASSVEVVADTWQVCDGPRFTGHCVILNPGRYPALVNFGLNDRVVSARAVNRKDANAGRDRGRVTFYEREGFGGQSFTTERRVGNFSRFGFNDRASSVEVMGAAWEVCEEAQFRGRCVVLLPGRYPSLASIGFGDRISSVRTAPNVNVNAAAVYESPMPPR